MKRFLLVSGLCAMSVVAFSFGTFTSVFNATYKPAKDSDLGKAACGVCHTGKKGGKLNAYGLDMDKELKAANSKKLTAEILKKIEGLDSDKDGQTNLVEIKAGKLPGSK